MVVACAGANSISKNEPSKGLKEIKQFRQNRKNTNVVMSAPHKFNFEILCNKEVKKTATDKADIQPHKDYKHEVM